MDPMGSEHQLDVTAAPQMEVPHSSSVFGFFRTHPYSSALSGAFLLIVGGTFIIVSRAPQPVSSGSAVAWGGGGAITPSYIAPSQTNEQTPESIMQQLQSGTPYNYTLPTPQVVSADAENTSGSFDFDSFISLLSNENATGTTKVQGSASSAYSFIPSGFISALVPKLRTTLQQKLYDYGNNVGSFVQSFEQDHPNEAQVLWDQAQDRTDPDKAAALTALAHALSALGDNLSQMNASPDDDQVPSQMTAAHNALAQSYKDLGTKLALVPSAQGDTAFVAAVEAYDTTAETFTQKYVALANLFVAYGVSFSPQDPGVVFTFSAAPSL